jgi:hypothetical protein
MAAIFVRPTPTAAFPLDGDDAQVLTRGSLAQRRRRPRPRCPGSICQRGAFSRYSSFPRASGRRRAIVLARIPRAVGQDAGSVKGCLHLALGRPHAATRRHPRGIGVQKRRYPDHAGRFEVESAARHLEYFAGFAGKIEGMSADLPDGRLVYGIHEPLGVVTQIVPWNSPLRCWPVVAQQH